MPAVFLILPFLNMSKCGRSIMRFPSLPRYFIVLLLINLALGLNLLVGPGRTVERFNDTVSFSKIEEAKIISVGQGGIAANVYIRIDFEIRGYVLLEVQDIVANKYQHTIRTEVIGGKYREYIPIPKDRHHQIRLENLTNQTVVFNLQVKYLSSSQGLSTFALFITVPVMLIAVPLVKLTKQLDSVQGGKSIVHYSPIGKNAGVSKESREAVLKKKNSNNLSK